LFPFTVLYIQYLTKPKKRKKVSRGQNAIFQEPNYQLKRNVNIQVFCHVMPFRLLNNYQSFVGPCCRQGKAIQQEVELLTPKYEGSMNLRIFVTTQSNRVAVKHQKLPWKAITLLCFWF